MCVCCNVSGVCGCGYAVMSAVCVCVDVGML